MSENSIDNFFQTNLSNYSLHPKTNWRDMEKNLLKNKLKKAGKIFSQAVLVIAIFALGWITLQDKSSQPPAKAKQAIQIAPYHATKSFRSAYITPIASKKGDISDSLSNKKNEIIVVKRTIVIRDTIGSGSNN